MTSDPLARALVRILADSRHPPRPVGAGFLIGPNRVLTCAHVIADALGIPRTTQTRPHAPVWLNLPLLADSEPCQGHVSADTDWYPLNDQARHGELEDIAVLTLTQQPAADAEPVAMALLSGADVRDRPVHLLGFPAGYDEGHWVSGRTKGVIGTGWVQLDNELGRHGVTPGFSGAAVWDNLKQAVIGMIVSVPKGERHVAYMIPAATLNKLAPERNRQPSDFVSAKPDYISIVDLAWLTHPDPQDRKARADTFAAIAAACDKGELSTTEGWAFRNVSEACERLPLLEPGMAAVLENQAKRRTRDQGLLFGTPSSSAANIEVPDVRLDDFCHWWTEQGNPDPIDRTSDMSQHRQSQMLPYGKALPRLQTRFPDLTQGELAMWVLQWNRNPKRGLPAYNRYNKPFSWQDVRSLRDLRACWFKLDDLDRFKPSQRWLTYQQLVERWRPLCDDPEQEIPAGVERHRDELGFSAHDPLHRRKAPLTEYMFLLSEVEAIEAEWFTVPTKQNTNQADISMSATAQRNTVFISYSHQDKQWLERLQVFLKPLEREGLIQRWDDTMIRPGQDWQREIEQALQSARVAVLLISADFLASDFINGNELPPLLERHANEGAVILPLILSPSRFAKTPNLARFQAVNLPTRPLIALSRAEQEAILVELTEAIEAALEQSPVVEPDSTNPETSSATASTKTTKMPEPPYSGPAKLAFCQRLGNNWHALADILNIPSHEQDRFTQGDEARAIWTWLYNRNRLDRLPQALANIDRDDLIEVLQTRPR